MTAPKQPWHKGAHQRLARLCVQAYYANPHTLCARCGRTLDQHPPSRNGRPARWTAGHRNDSTIATSTADYQPEADTCGSSAGASYGNRQRNDEPHTERW